MGMWLWLVGRVGEWGGGRQDDGGGPFGLVGGTCRLRWFASIGWWVALNGFPIVESISSGAVDGGNCACRVSIGVVELELLTLAALNFKPNTENSILLRSHVDCSDSSDPQGSFRLWSILSLPCGLFFCGRNGPRAAKLLGSKNVAS